MIAKTFTVAFDGTEARTVEVQCAVTAGLPSFSIVGLADKAVSEARERVRAALGALSIALPLKRITVNLSPADLPKEGSHFDLPVALALLAAIGVAPPEAVEGLTAIGELSLDGRLIEVAGALPAAMNAAGHGRALLCPAGSGGEAAWIAAAQVFAAPTLAAALRHVAQQAPLAPCAMAAPSPGRPHADLAEVKGQGRAKRALEIAAAGRHHLLLVGPPGAGKSMLAARLPGIMPPPTAAEALQTAMIHSVAGLLRGGPSLERPFRDPHHTASVAAMIGGGRRAAPGEISLAHNGVLFLDEFPEFSRPALEALRQPLEIGEVTIARANAHLRYPCRFLLAAAANPCRCGHLADAARACAKAPKCGADYLGSISGPLFDRLDLRIETPALDWSELAAMPTGESSAAVAARVAKARAIQSRRFASRPGIETNADASGRLLDEIAAPDAEGLRLLERISEKFGLSARGYHRVLRVARTIADLAGSETVRAPHLAEAAGHRLSFGGG